MTMTNWMQNCQSRSVASVMSWHWPMVRHGRTSSPCIRRSSVFWDDTAINVIAPKQRLSSFHERSTSWGEVRSRVLSSQGCNQQIAFGEREAALADQERAADLLRVVSSGLGSAYEETAATTSEIHHGL